jgi:hypothetical protein
MRGAHAQQTSHHAPAAGRACVTCIEHPGLKGLPSAVGQALRRKAFVSAAKLPNFYAASVLLRKTWPLADRRSVCPVGAKAGLRP